MAATVKKQIDPPGSRCAGPGGIDGFDAAQKRWEEFSARIDAEFVADQAKAEREKAKHNKRTK